MYRMIIELDEEKIVKENKYYLNDVLSHVDSYFEEKKISKIEKGVYEDSGEKLVQFLGIITRLSRSDVFTRYVKKWLWYENDEEIVSNDPQNLIEKFSLN